MEKDFNSKSFLTQNKLKKILSILLIVLGAISMALAIFVTPDTDDSEGTNPPNQSTENNNNSNGTTENENSDFTFELNADGTYAVTGYNGTSNSITIPNTYNNKKVTSIGDNAFELSEGLTSITMSNSVTTIGDYAFYKCSNLISLTLSDSLTSIGNNAVSYCSKLKSVTIPDKVTTIGEWAFYQCSALINITIPVSVTSIGYYAFYGNTNLISVFYKGTAENWENISIDSSNRYLTDATLYFYSEAKPSSSGHYWHYVNGNPVVW